MGAYLSEPVVEKETEEGSIDRLKFSATRMQGWRVHQEDAHNCICDYSEGTSYFAVYDGHGGSEVSAYSAKHLPEFVKRMENWENGRHGQALRDAFLEFDKHLLSESALAELKILAGKDDEVNNNSDEEQEDRRLLIEESVLPLEQLLQKYGLRFRKSGTSPQSSSGGRCRKFLSPNVGRKKTKSVIKLNSDGVDSQTESSVASENKLPLNTFSQSIEEEDEEGQGPCTPPSSPDNSASEKKATKRSFPGNVERTTVVDLEPNRCSEKVSEDSLQVESVAKRLKVSRALEEEKITNTCESSTDSVNGFVPSGKKDSVESETVKESERGKNKTDIRRSVSEVSVAGSGSGSENDVNSKLAKRSNFVPAVDSDAVDMVGRQSHVTCHRHRSSKSESEVKILKMEDDSLGPVTNWKTIGPLSSDTDTPGRSTG